MAEQRPNGASTWTLSNINEAPWFDRMAAVIDKDNKEYGEKSDPTSLDLEIVDGGWLSDATLAALEKQLGRQIDVTACEEPHVNVLLQTWIFEAAAKQDETTLEAKLRQREMFWETDDDDEACFALEV